MRNHLLGNIIELSTVLRVLVDEIQRNVFVSMVSRRHAVINPGQFYYLAEGYFASLVRTYFKKGSDEFREADLKAILIEMEKFSALFKNEIFEGKPEAEIIGKFLRRQKSYRHLRGIEFIFNLKGVFANELPGSDNPLKNSVPIMSQFNRFAKSYYGNQGEGYKVYFERGLETKNQGSWDVFERCSKLFH